MSAEPEERFQEDLSHLVHPNLPLFHKIVQLATTYAAERMDETLSKGVEVAIREDGLPDRDGVVKLEHGDMIVTGYPVCDHGFHDSHTMYCRGPE